MDAEEGTSGEGLQLASELIRARSELGLTQVGLAEKSGLSRSAIKGYETGRNLPGARELRALCQALKVTPNRLLFSTEAPAFESNHSDVLSSALRADPNNHMLQRLLLATVSEMLAPEEAQALLTLAQALAVARHGAERVRSKIEGTQAMGMALRLATAQMARGPDGDPSQIVPQFEAWLKSTKGDEGCN